MTDLQTIYITISAINSIPVFITIGLCFTLLILIFKWFIPRY